MHVRLNLDHHPCFNVEATGHCGRVHLPVAPKCNIKCNYCNRKYDCANESRPGVTSAVLTPSQAIRYLSQVVEREPRITVVGIAGPGDPFANPEETLETLRLVRKKFPHLLICLATNGLNLVSYLDEMEQIEVSHVTITVNAVDPQIGQHIYSWVRDGKVIYRGLAAAELLLARQIEAIKGLIARGIVVKVNTIVVPGVNDHHVEDVAQEMAEIGVDLLNCMPIYPNADTPFADVVEPTEMEMERIRKQAEEHLPQMRHCTRCRADAVGLLDSDRSEEFQGCLESCAATFPETGDRPYVAVASREGVLVNQHLGEATRFQIWGQGNGDFRLIEERPAPSPGSGLQRWEKLAETLSDCRAVLVSGIGDRPKQVLQNRGVLPAEMSGFIELGLEAIYSNRNPSVLKGRRQSCSKGRCGGESGGCG